MHGWQDQETASSGPPLLFKWEVKDDNRVSTANWGPLPLSLPSLNRVYHSAEYPSSLTLPIVPGAKAQAPPPPCGSLQFQPCRFAPKPTR